jgi:glycosyltransferase involved in cell wall biosynthesis
MGRVTAQQAEPAQHPDPQPARLPPCPGTGTERDEFAVDVPGHRPSQLDRVPLAAAEQAFGAERRRDDVNDAHLLTVSLVTLGDPQTMTGGYLYHRRVADRASAHHARVEFVSFPPRRFPLPALAGAPVLRAVAHRRADVLLLDSIAAAFLSPWLVCRRPLLPLVGILHQPPGGIDHGAVRRWAQSVLDRRAYRHAARLLVASADLAEAMCRAGVPERLLRVVPPGRDPAAALVLPGTDLRAGRRAAVLCVGNWVARKGLLDLLEAVARLPEDTVTLHLVGDTEAEPGYAARIRARLTIPDLVNRVVVHGPRSAAETAGFYRAADVFALTSIREPYGTVYGEAMAAGLPVVGWAAGNLPHLARHGVDGFAVPPGDRRALTAALRSLALDESLRQRMARAAARRAAGFPTWDDTARMLFAELRAVVRETQGARRPLTAPSRPCP